MRYILEEKTIYENKNGSIIKTTDFFGNPRYCLLDRSGNHVRDLTVPFRVGDYL